MLEKLTHAESSMWMSPQPDGSVLVRPFGVLGGVYKTGADASEPFRNFFKHRTITGFVVLAAFLIVDSFADLPLGALIGVLIVAMIAWYTYFIIKVRKILTATEAERIPRSAWGGPNYAERLSLFAQALPRWFLWIFVVLEGLVTGAVGLGAWLSLQKGDYAELTTRFFMLALVGGGLAIFIWMLRANGRQPKPD